MAKGQKTGGREKGTPNKTTAAVKEMLIAAFDDMGGLDALTDWGRENRTQFYQLWAKLLPQEIKSEVELKNDITAEERHARLAAILDAARARRARETGDAAE
jgi:hypothetical protein